MRRFYLHALLRAKKLISCLSSRSLGVLPRAAWIGICLVSIGVEARAVPELAPDGNQGVSGEAPAFESIDALLREVGNPQAQVGSGVPTNDSSSPTGSIAPAAEVAAPDSANDSQFAESPSLNVQEALKTSYPVDSLQLARASADDPNKESMQNNMDGQSSVNSSAGAAQEHSETTPNTAAREQPLQPALASPSDAKGVIAEIMTGSKTGAMDFTKLMLAVLGALLGVTLIAWHIMKSREARDGSPAKSVRALQLSATLPLGPKRQILLVRVRDTELALASTEHGISLLGEVGNSNRSAVASQLASSHIVATPLVDRGQTQVSLPAADPRGLLADAPRSQMTGKKSEILRKALETIESRKKGESSNAEVKAPSGRRSQGGNPESANEGTSLDATSLVDRRNLQTNASRSTLPPGPEAQRFKKFFTNSYKNQNTDRQANKTPGQESSGQESERVPMQFEAENQTDNVAQLIREKLKQMRTIS